MKVSIITVAYNAADTIADTIESVAQQDHVDIEHIIIDGASSDGTIEIVDRYRESLAIVVSEPDQGIYDAMNKGLRMATGEIVGMLNADDIYADNGVISRVAGVFAEDEGLDGVYGDIVFVNRQSPQKTVRYWKSRPYRDGLFEKGWMPPHPTFFVRSEVYRRYGDFDTRFRIQSDFDLCMRFMAIHHVRTRYLPGVMVKMRMGGVTSSGPVNVIKGNIEAYNACRKNGLKVSPLFIARKILSRVPQFLRRPAAGRAQGGGDER
jgi:glycosyltransferase involved in cell wall biosynthesis